GDAATWPGERAVSGPVLRFCSLTGPGAPPPRPLDAVLCVVRVSGGARGGGRHTAPPRTPLSDSAPPSPRHRLLPTSGHRPGRVFGDAVYAISRGAGGNPAAVDRPGVIYRVNTATGKASLFFDLNTVLNQTDPNNTTPGRPAANSMGADTGLVNWYSITFDP